MKRADAGRRRGSVSVRVAPCQSALKDKMPTPALSSKKGRPENIAAAGGGTSTQTMISKSKKSARKCEFCSFGIYYHEPISLLFRYLPRPYMDIVDDLRNPVNQRLLNVEVLVTIGECRHVQYKFVFHLYLSNVDFLFSLTFPFSTSLSTVRLLFRCH